MRSRFSLLIVTVLGLAADCFGMTYQRGVTLKSFPSDLTAFSQTFLTNPPASVTTFLTTDTMVAVAFAVSGQQTGDVLSIDFVMPSGQVLAAASTQWDPVTSDQLDQPHLLALAELPIAGQAAAGSPGQWSAKIYYHPAATTSRTLLGTLTFTITASGASCTYTLSATSASLAAAGGTGSVSVTAGSGCNWTAVSNASWITVTSGTSGSGNGSVGYSAGANSGSSARTGTITIAGQTFTVSQAGAGGATTYDAAGGFTSTNPSGVWSYGYQVQMGSGFTLFAYKDTTGTPGIVAWEYAQGPFPGQSVLPAVAKNTTSSTITVGTLQLPPDVLEMHPGSAGQYAIVRFTAPSASTYSFGGSFSGLDIYGTTTDVHVLKNGGTSLFSGAVPGSGGNPTFNITQNLAAGDTVDFAVGYGSNGNYFNDSTGLKVTVTAGTSPVCTYSLSPASASPAAGGGTGSVSVTAASGCSWTATSNNTSWLTVVSGASGSGNGTVGYSVTANTGSSARSGTITIAGQTFTVTQAGAASTCYYTLSPTSQIMGGAYWTGSVVVTAPPGCAWTAVSTVSWITLTGGASGSGNGMLYYAVAANPDSTQRTGTITVMGQTFTVQQAGSPPACNYMIGVPTASAPAAGTTGTVSVSAESGCTWTATSNNSSWLSVTSGATGSGNGTVTYTVAANTGTSSRTGTLTIAGFTFTLTQAGAACTYTLGSTSASAAAAGTSGSITVTAASGCAWTAVSSVSWITVTSGASGTGSGTVAYTVTANSDSSSRTGTITIGGQTFTVTQSGSSTSDVVLKVDGGTFTRALGFTQAQPHAYFVNRLTPPGYPATLKNVQVYFGNRANGLPLNTAITVVWAATASSGNTISGVTFSTLAATVNALGSFNTYTVSPMTITSGDFLVGFMVNSQAGVYPADEDVDTASQQRSYYSTNGSTFNLLDVQAGAANLAIRATVNVGSGGGGSTCTYQLQSPATTALPRPTAGGLVILTADGCPWTAVSSANWITITSATSGTGTTMILYKLDINSAQDQRLGTITVGGQTYYITQIGMSACSFTLSLTSGTAPAAGTTNGIVNVIVWSGCPISVVPNVSWITITSTDVDLANGLIRYTVAPYTGQSARTGTITIAGLTYTVTQAGICTYSISPTSASLAAAGGTGSVSVTSPSGCPWTAASGASWITITSGTPGSGNGTVNYSVGANTATTSRTGTATIAGQTFTVTESGYTPGGSQGSVIGISLEAGSYQAGTFTATSQVWDTLATSTHWVLGVSAPDVTSPLLNASDKSVNLTAGTYYIYGEPTSFGTAARLTVQWSGGGQDQAVFSPGSLNAAAAWTALAGSSNIGLASTGITSANRVSATLTAGGSADFVLKLTVASSGGGTGSGTNLLANGGFEQPGGTDHLGATGSFLTGWTVSRGNVDYIQTYFTCSEGSYCLDLDGTPGPGGVAQTVATTPGAAYTVTFDMAGNPGAGPTIKQMRVQAAGQSADFSFDITGHINTNMGWTTKTWSFTANSASTTLELYSLDASDSNFGPALDNVRLTAGGSGGGTGCTFAISPATASVGAAGGTGSVTVTAGSGCSWSATSNAAWIAVTSGASGSGNGTAGYSVAANTDASSRTGTITIAGQTFTVNQSGATANCSYGISPSSATIAATGGAGSVNLTAGTGCSWTAASNASWIKVTAGATGSGNGVVQYSVDANTAASGRTGTLTVAGQRFTVNQAAAAPFGNGPVISSGGVVNGADFTANFAPGGIITIYGSNLAAALDVGPNAPLTASLDGVTVEVVDGSKTLTAPLYFVSPGQINAQLPFELTSRTVQIHVRRGQTVSNDQIITWETRNPRLFTNPSGGTGVAAVIHNDGKGTLVSDAAPAQPGEVLTVYLTGLGSVTPAAVTGQPGGDNAGLGALNSLDTTAMVTVDGEFAEVLWAGLAPSYVGLYQVNFYVPEYAASGTLELKILAEDRGSQANATMSCASAWQTLASSTIGAAGGTVTAGGLTLTVPAGAFAGASAVTVARNSAPADGATGDTFGIGGLPATTSTPLTVTIDVPGPAPDPDTTYVVIAEVSAHGGELFLKATVQGNRVTATLPPRTLGVRAQSMAPSALRSASAAQPRNQANLPDMVALFVLAGGDVVLSPGKNLLFISQTKLGISAKVNGLAEMADPSGGDLDRFVAQVGFSVAWTLTKPVVVYLQDSGRLAFTPASQLDYLQFAAGVTISLRDNWSASYIRLLSPVQRSVGALHESLIHELGHFLQDQAAPPTAAELAATDTSWIGMQEALARAVGCKHFPGSAAPTAPCSPNDILDPSQVDDSLLKAFADDGLGHQSMWDAEGEAVFLVWVAQSFSKLEGWATLGDIAIQRGSGNNRLLPVEALTNALKNQVLDVGDAWVGFWKYAAPKMGVDWFTRMYEYSDSYLMTFFETTDISKNALWYGATDLSMRAFEVDVYRPWPWTDQRTLTIGTSATGLTKPPVVMVFQVSASGQLTFVDSGATVTLADPKSLIAASGRLLVLVVNLNAVSPFQNSHTITVTASFTTAATSAAMDEIRKSNMFRVQLTGAFSCTSTGSGGSQPGGTLEASNWAPGEALAPLTPFTGNTFDAHATDPSVGDFTMHVEFSVNGSQAQGVSINAARFILTKNGAYNSVSTDITISKPVPFHERTAGQGVWYYFDSPNLDVKNAVTFVWTSTTKDPKNGSVLGATTCTGFDPNWPKVIPTLQIQAANLRWCREALAAGLRAGRVACY